MTKESLKSQIAVLAIIILTISRFLFLDQDAPSYMVGGITQEDEPFYSLGAISRYNDDHGRLIAGFERPPGEGLMLYNTHLTYLSMKTFGNTYWGLRLPAVVLSVLTILLLIDILKKLNVNKNYVLLVILYIFTDFYFFIFSRFQTPQIYSLFAVTWVIWLYFKYGMSSGKGLFLIGFFAFFAITFVYLLNIFMLMTFGFLALRQSYVQKKIKPLLFFSLGIIVCLVAYAGTLNLIGSSIKEVFFVLTTHGNGPESSPGSTASLFSIKSLYSKLIQLPITNLFRYNLAILFVFFFAFPFIVRKIVFERSEKYLMYLLFVGGLILQSFFIVSYGFKKLIIVFPMVVIILGDVLPQAIVFYRQMSLKRKLFLLAYGAVVLAFCFINFRLNNSRAYWDGLKCGYYENTTFLYNIFNILVLVVIITFLLINLFSNRIRYSLVLVLPAILGIVLISKYCFIEKSFYAKEGFEKASYLLKDKGVIMAVSYTAQFYTECKPALDCYVDRYVYAENYGMIGDSLFRNGLADFTIEKVKESDLSESNENPNLVMVMSIPMKHYAMHIYKYAGPRN